MNSAQDIIEPKPILYWSKAAEWTLCTTCGAGVEGQAAVSGTKNSAVGKYPEILMHGG